MVHFFFGGGETIDRGVDFYGDGELRVLLKACALRFRGVGRRCLLHVVGLGVWGESGHGELSFFFSGGAGRRFLKEEGIFTGLGGS